MNHPKVAIAYALIRHGIPGECPASINFGFADKLADSLLASKGVPKASRTKREKAATIESLLNPNSDVWGFNLVRAETVVLKEAVWTLDFDDVKIYYDGPETNNEYKIREWLEKNIHDLSIKHAIFEMLVDFDRDLDAPGLVTAIKQQMDEVGGHPPRPEGRGFHFNAGTSLHQRPPL